MASNIDRMKKAMQKNKQPPPKEPAPDQQPEPEQKKPVQRKSNKKSPTKIFGTMDEIFEKLKGEKKKKSNYTQFRMKTEVIEDMRAIAEAETGKSHGYLIHEVLQKFINEYKEKKSAK